MNKAITIITMIMLVATLGTIAYATAPTEAEMQAFQSAMSLYEQSMGIGMGMPFDPNADPNAEPPTPEQLKQNAILAFQSFITAYPTSEIAPVAQNYIGWCYFELGNNTQAKTEFGKVVTNYPASKLIDDARYQIAFIEFQGADYTTALAEL